MHSSRASACVCFSFVRKTSSSSSSSRSSSSRCLFLKSERKSYWRRSAKEDDYDSDRRQSDRLPSRSSFFSREGDDDEEAFREEEEKEEGCYHVVAPGDSLYGIALTHDVSPKELEVCVFFFFTAPLLRCESDAIFEFFYINRWRTLKSWEDSNTCCLVSD